MGFLSHLFYPWGLILQGLALLHFLRRRPDTYWIYIVLFLGPVGALIYLVVEALPDISLLRGVFRVIPRRNRIRALQSMIRDNPSSGNYEELGDLYLDDGKLAEARSAYDCAINAHANTTDPFYRRGVCAVLMGDAPASLPDLERAVATEPGYDFYRAAGLLAHAYALSGQTEKAEALFRQTTDRSTNSETYLNFAELLAAEGRNAEARAWAQKVLDKRPSIPAFQRRRERPWFWKARKMLKRVAV